MIQETNLKRDMNDGYAGIISALIERGEEGYLTYDDILEVHPQAEDDITLVENIVSTMEKLGIEFIQYENEEPEDTPSQKPFDPLFETHPKLEGMEQNNQHIGSDDLVELYFHEAARRPLLTKEEEIYLARMMEKGKKARQKLAQGDVSAEKQQKLQIAINRGWEARKQLFIANTRLVISVAKRYQKKGVPFLDLIQEGNIGLIRAIKKFEYRRGFKFSTYATWWIRQAVTRAIAYQGRTIRIPVHMGDKLSRLYRTRETLKQNLKRDPTEEELANAMQTTVSQVERMLQISRHTISLDKPVNTDEDSSLADFIPDQHSPTPEDTVNSSLLRSQLIDLLAEIPTREARLLMLRYGLMDGQNRSLNEVGKIMGVSRERVRQIESKALRRLRKINLTAQLRNNLDLSPAHQNH